MHKPSPDTPNDRRRRSRLHGATQGWIMPDQPAPPADLWEVRVKDVSRQGVGFESSEQLASGAVCRIRIGRGPIELSRRIRVVRCAPGEGNVFEIGGEFVDGSSPTGNPPPSNTRN